MLTISNMSLSYDSIKAVSDLNLSVKPGQIITMLGANGSGKSSVISGICGLKKCTGQITLNGQDISSKSATERSRLGMATVLEGRHIFSRMTVEENLLLGAYTTRIGRKSLKEGLDSIYSQFPRLWERKKQLAGTMSGGEQQMLALGRALISKPHTILLDEPSMGLAPKLVLELFCAIENLKNSGLAVLLVEQNASLALNISDHVYLLKKGTCVSDGPASAFRDKSVLQRAYLG